MSTKFSPAKFQPLNKQKALSDVTVRVLRLVVSRDPHAPIDDLVEACGGNQHRLVDTLHVLERRWLITWEGHGRVIRPRQRGIDLLKVSAYRERGLS